MNKLLHLATLVAPVGLLAACNFKPPSKAWIDVVDRPFRIEQLDCAAAAGSEVGERCHLEVVDSQPERFLRVTKPKNRNFRIEFVTGGPEMDKSAKTEEIGMTCKGLSEKDNYELDNGKCVMDNAPGKGKGEQPHVHKIFTAQTEWKEVDGKKVWRIKFSFDHKGPRPRHNGTGHTLFQ